MTSSNVDIPGTQVTIDFAINSGTHTTEYGQLYLSGNLGSPVLPSALSSVATVGMLEEYRIYVRDPDPDPVPSLAVARVYPNTDAVNNALDPNAAAVDIADGISELQVALGSIVTSVHPRPISTATARLTSSSPRRRAAKTTTGCSTPQVMTRTIHPGCRPGTTRFPALRGLPASTTCGSTLSPRSRRSTGTTQRPRFRDSRTRRSPPSTTTTNAGSVDISSRPPST